MSESELAFVIMQFGDSGSTERARADEVADYVVKPAVEKFGLQLYRADRDPTPGQITPQILKKLIAARVVIADLTGRNPNVYYELGVAHSFGRPVVVLCDKTSYLAFDTKDERVITLGDAGILGVAQADHAQRSLINALQIVLAEGHHPVSVVSEVATSRSLDALAPDNPIVSELTLIRESMQELRNAVKQQRRPNASSIYRYDINALKPFLEDQIAVDNISLDDLAKLYSYKFASPQLRNWLSDLIDSLDDRPHLRKSLNQGPSTDDEGFEQLRAAIDRKA